MKNLPDIVDIVPFTPAQEFYLGEGPHNGGTAVGVQQYTYRITGLPMEEGRFRAAWQAVVDAHPALRSSLHVSSVSRPFQVVHTAAPVRLLFEDMRALPEEERQSVAAAYREKDANLALDWHAPPLMRVCLHRFEDELALLTVTLDHMIFDGWSLGVLIQDFKTAYADPAALAPAASARAYMHWHEEQDCSGALDWYAGKLAGARPAPLPLAEEKSAADICADSLEFHTFTAEETRAVMDAARRFGVTPNALFQGAWALLLSRMGGTAEAYFLTSVASRPSGVAGIDRMCNLLLGLIPYHIPCPGGDPLREWLRGIHDWQVATLDYHHVPPLDVLRLHPGLGDPSVTSCLVFQNMDTGETREAPEAGEAAIVNEDVRSRSSYPLVVAAFPAPVLLLSFLYDQDMFTGDAVRTLADALAALLLGMAGAEAGTDLDSLCSGAGLPGACAAGDSRRTSVEGRP